MAKKHYFCTAMTTTPTDSHAEELARELRQLVGRLYAEGRTDLLLRAIGVPMLELLRTEAARGTLSRLIVTRDGRLVLERGQREVVLTPVHRAVYLLFLRHPEGIEFKNLSDHYDELLAIYNKVTPGGDPDKAEETVARLTNPLDNAINEKCSRIKAAFTALLDDYQSSYYIISSHKTRMMQHSQRVWFQRLKLITLPRELVVYE